MELYDCLHCRKCLPRADMVKISGFNILCKRCLALLDTHLIVYHVRTYWYLTGRSLDDFVESDMRETAIRLKAALDK